MWARQSAPPVVSGQTVVLARTACAKAVAEAMNSGVEVGAAIPSTAQMVAKTSVEMSAQLTQADPAFWHAVKSFWRPSITSQQFSVLPILTFLTWRLPMPYTA
ncbi:MAG TPA: hypothetical protein DIT01_20850 [Lentisphaeria bacterium]|nr:hypothetical protein [Lentisphaeria bacterium]